MSLASQDVPITSLAISIQTTAVSQGERWGGGGVRGVMPHKLL